MLLLSSLSCCPKQVCPDRPVPYPVETPQDCPLAPQPTRPSASSATECKPDMVCLSAAQGRTLLLYVLATDAWMKQARACLAAAASRPTSRPAASRPASRSAAPPKPLDRARLRR